MQLSKRLEAILEMIYKAKGNSLADIGTDHGYVPIEAVSRGYVDRAFACDVNRGPLDAAAQHIIDAGLEDRVMTRLGDGLSAIDPGEADLICISGMGGELMTKIISADEFKAKKSNHLVFSPQSELSEFRKYLIDNMYEIEAENCIEEDGKFYFIMLVKYDCLANGRVARRPRSDRFRMFNDLSPEDGYVARESRTASHGGESKIAMLAFERVEAAPAPDTREYRKSQFAVSNSDDMAEFTAEYGDSNLFSGKALETRKRCIEHDLRTYKSIVERLAGEESENARESRIKNEKLVKRLEAGLKFEW